ncbi:MAG TPA: RpiB/LacA/LacB family sugar-phosphate isomerase [Patescibacteria group bacterium]|nr:RpiB/LacA/LacB family sugar-phosphate isomerase [Patescibacteria group bacterium]
MKIYIGSDHRGYYLKEKIAKWLFEWGYEFTDLGASSYDEKDDYTKYASEVASIVGDRDRDREEVRGILLCGSGVGVDVTANKFDGVRASIGIDPDQVREGREDDDMNVLVIAADHTSEHDVKEMIKGFLETKFDEKARHVRRLNEIEKIEANN